MESLLKEFEEIYEEFGDSVFRYLFIKTGNRERSLEISQEVFMKIWSYMSSGKKIENPKAFVFRSAHNAFVNEIRSKKKVISLDMIMEEGFEPESETNELEVRETLEKQQEVLKKISELEDDDKTILVLKYVEDLSVPEIGKVLKISENHVSVRIHRAKQKLKKIYLPRDKFDS